MSGGFFWVSPRSSPTAIDRSTIFFTSRSTQFRSVSFVITLFSISRFSNKQAKLMKSQKFASELENLVDVSKVKMDVMKPWIATRVTELLGFEDEVLINFIYGLIDKKVVNGKEIQIAITGFMEKNTVKFMKELCTLLFSAQSNESRIPQQFLDARVAATMNLQDEAIKKADQNNQLVNEIGKRKEMEHKSMRGKL